MNIILLITQLDRVTQPNYLINKKMNILFTFIFSSARTQKRFPRSQKRPSVYDLGPFMRSWENIFLVHPAKKRHELALPLPRLVS